MNSKHYSVLLDETIDSLNIKKNGTYVDLTLGRGGHSEAILKLIPDGLLVAFDKDEIAIKESEARLNKVSTNFKLIHSDFINFKNELCELGIKNVDGIIADLGFSSPQVDDATRGFSYNKNGNLDMRMDQSQKLDAHTIINEWSENELISIFKTNADVLLPQRIAKAIVNNRPINTTLELVDVIRNSLPAAVVRQKNPAKQVFQAIRIAVNNEFDSLKAMLKDSIEILSEDGVIAVITFHSIEDKIVKNFFREFIKDDSGKLPIIVEKKFVSKQLTASKKELEENKRSRSAKLRILKKIGKHEEKYKH